MATITAHYRRFFASSIACLGTVLISTSAIAQTPNKSVADPALLNVLNQPLQSCSQAPQTGYLRNGYCA
ncbi:MAG: DUF2237 family protein, partial [Betaproteobacteria bacterium]|nr:DUF2237 family protein [Betaproteobacteria bacterium]